MDIWLTSDTHFGHENIIKYMDRPWDNAREMDEALIENWNSVVGPNHIVWHLGDFAFDYNVEKYFGRLNGKIHICWGNHDRSKNREVIKPWVEWYGDVNYIRWNHEHFFLSHYAHRVWRNSHHGTYHVYGHSHGDIPGLGRSMDVGVDAVEGYKPIHIEEVYKRLKDKPITDHHGPRR